MTLLTRTGRLSPAVRKAMREVNAELHRGRGRIEVEQPMPSGWKRLDDVIIPQTWARGPFHVRIRFVQQQGMFKHSRMVVWGETTASIERDGSVVLGDWKFEGGLTDAG